jgi:inner membrane protein
MFKHMENVSQPNLNLLDRFNRWIQESIMVKLFSIGVLVLVLLIPAVWIDDLIHERQYRAGEVIDEVANKWSDSQLLSGPMLMLPYRKKELVEHGPNNKELVERVEKAFFLPEQFDVNGTVTPEQLHRGIFDVVVYESTLQMRATFGKPDLGILSIPEDAVIWKDASLVFGISDLRGITDNPLVTLGDSTYTPEPSSNIGLSLWQKTDESVKEEYGYIKPELAHDNTSGITVNLGWTALENFKGDFQMNLKLKGSRRLDFLPTGKTTTVKLAGSWSNPSFDGYLPTERVVNDNDFTASWKILHFNRPFSQQWIGGDQQLGGTDFGVKLLMPVDQYQKSTRTAKYGILVVLLTFMALFLVEITQKVRIHPFQYILVGAALIIYYTLLLSFSEHLGYNIAYAIASAATVILVGLYARTFLQSRLAVLVTLLLTVFYGFIFVIILQQDFSLLLGSIGLFVIVSLLMYFSRRVNWYKEATA